MKIIPILIILTLIISCNIEKEEDVKPIEDLISIDSNKKNTEVGDFAFSSEESNFHTDENDSIMIKTPDGKLYNKKLLGNIIPIKYKDFIKKSISYGASTAKGTSFTNAQTVYQKGKSYLVLRISDFGKPENFLDYKFIKNIPEDDYFKVSKLVLQNGEGYIEWNESTNSGIVNTFLHNRFQIYLEINEINDFDLEVKSFIESIPLKKIIQIEN